jgi:surface antigen
LCAFQQILESSLSMRRFFLATFCVAGLVAVLALPQAAQAHELTSSASASSHISAKAETHLTSQATYPNRYPWGQCTWWAAQTRLDENLEGLGNAVMWFSNASRRGLPIGYAPAVGATAVFGPGVQGAGGLGHVAHVVAVQGARFELSEMNFYGGSPRGGFGKVDYRWATAGIGVGFIY